MFKDRLRASRMSNDITIQKISEEIGVSVRSYQRYEGGKTEPPYKTLIKISDFLNVPIDFLLERDEYLKSLGVSVDVSLDCPPRRPKHHTSH